MVASNKVIEIKKVAFQDLQALYPEMYLQVFDEIDMFQMPSLIYLVFKDGEYLGFMSGYLHNATTFYLQYAGINRDKRGYGTLEMWQNGLAELDKDFMFVITIINNNNIPAIKLALHQGFKIHGCRQDTGNNYYVEMIRKKGGI